MCHGYLDLQYLRRDSDDRVRDLGRLAVPAPGAARPGGGLVALIRRIFGAARPATMPVPIPVRVPAE